MFILYRFASFVLFFVSLYRVDKDSALYTDMQVFKAKEGKDHILLNFTFKVCFQSKIMRYFKSLRKLKIMLRFIEDLGLLSLLISDICEKTLLGLMYLISEYIGVNECSFIYHLIFFVLFFFLVIYNIRLLMLLFFFHSNGRC